MTKQTKNTLPREGNKSEVSNPCLKEIREFSEQELESLSVEERQAHFDEARADMQKMLDNDPRGSFFDLALGTFDDAIENKNNVTDRDFNYMAGMAIQYSDYSILTEIAMNLMKVMLILKNNDPKCSEFDTKDMSNVLDHYFLRLRLLTDLIIELIYQERDGELIINNNFEHKCRDLLLNLIDAAIQHDRDSEK